jgi:hypothetical protein
MLKKVMSSFVSIFQLGVQLISQKPSFERIHNELELMEKRRQSLNNMFNLGKITQATYEYLSKDLNGAITELKAHKENITVINPDNVEKQLKALPTTNLETSLISKDVTPQAAVVNVLPEKPPKKPTKKITKKGRKRVRKKKRKSSSKKSTSKALRASSRGHCNNPWNGKCKNANTDVVIYFNNKMLPICRDCWHQIVDKNITW